uniref:Uncharacterized protein n=1 Tax=Panagrellus redivivus TaxID=6233 RepID=A0A7E4VAB6_PANRE
MITDTRRRMPPPPPEPQPWAITASTDNANLRVRLHGRARAQVENADGSSHPIGPIPTASTPEAMPSSKNRRNARSVKQRRKMKLHNRKDDIPDCESLEIVDFDETNPDPSLIVRSEDESSFRPANSDHDFYDRQEDPSPPNAEVKVSLTDINGSEAANAASYESSFHSIGESGLAPSGSNSEYGPPTSTLPSNAGTTERRHRRRRLRKRRPGDPSPIVQMIQSLLENCGKAVTDFFLYLCSLIKVSSTHPTPTGVLIVIVCTYFCISYIEVSLAGMVQLVFEWLWPTLHIMLRMIERGFKGIAGFFAGLDDVAESSYCDMASMWCDYFDLMCDSRCSFTKFALDRLRN